MSAVKSEVVDGVQIITLNRPERLNAINEDLLGTFKQALHHGNSTDDVGCIVLRGAGRAFCSGDDLKEFEAQAKSEKETYAYIESIQDVSRLIVNGDKVVVGAIHGWAVGGGLEWAINCDLAIYAEGTRCFFPETSLGLFVTCGVTTLLPKLVGPQRALELILLGEQLDAAEALRLGLASKVVPLDQLHQEALALARKITKLPRAVVSDVKRTLNRACYLDLEGAMKLETLAAVRSFHDAASLQRVQAHVSGLTHARAM